MPDRKNAVQRGYFFLSFLAFLCHESHRLNTGSSCYESKRSIHRSAHRSFSQHQRSNPFLITQDFVNTPHSKWFNSVSRDIITSVNPP